MSTNGSFEDTTRPGIVVTAVYVCLFYAVHLGIHASTWMRIAVRFISILGIIAGLFAFTSGLVYGGAYKDGRFYHVVPVMIHFTMPSILFYWDTMTY